MSINPNDLKEQISIVPPEKEFEKAPDSRENREYTFHISWKDGQGQEWAGNFTNKVPDIGTRQMIGVLRAQLANNVPMEALDPITQEINLMVAHMTYSLEKRPEWAENLSEIMDVRLLQTIYAEVLAHEGMFLGYGSFTSTSEKESGNRDSQSQKMVDRQVPDSRE